MCLLFCLCWLWCATGCTQVDALEPVLAADGDDTDGGTGAGGGREAGALSEAEPLECYASLTGEPGLHPGFDASGCGESLVSPCVSGGEGGAAQGGGEAAGRGGPAAGGAPVPEGWPR